MKLATRLTAKQAREAGFEPLTTGYSTNEYKMLQRVIDDLRRDAIPFALVAEHSSEPNVLTVYRKGNNNGNQ